MKGKLISVEELLDNAALRDDLSTELSGCQDMERLMTRILYGTANARELRALCATAQHLPVIKSAVSECKSALLCEIERDIDTLDSTAALIDTAIVEEPPFSVREGGIIKQGFNDELDSLRNIVDNGKGFIADIQLREQEKTGIKKLKIGYNRVFGYYIEVSNSFKELVPETYIRKQTLTNAERFITEELKREENKILGAKDKIIALENDIFNEVRDFVATKLDEVQKTASALAILDVMASFSYVSSKNQYVRPDISVDGTINIKDGRHPVVEKMLDGAPFVPNDTRLGAADNQVSIITGPNMAGKSTYMRQVALIVLMAQMGSFVPARSAKIGLVDRVFTRIGASDDLASGQSTFMVEMAEVASILKYATSRSLLILDEIGRGTSTYDGMAIARAVLEYAANPKRLGAKTLFATHYHELSTMEDKLPNVKNYNIAVKKRGDQMIFLRKIVPGATDDSYGIEVAKLAGIPNVVISRAREILAELETEGVVHAPAAVPQEAEDQVTLLDLTGQQIIAALNTISVETLTPIEAMNELYRLKKMLD